jgi:hypothetical protein
MISTLRFRFMLLLAGILMLVLCKGFKVSLGKSPAASAEPNAEQGHGETADNPTEHLSRSR